MRAFTTYAPYDDEGYVIIALRQFAEGRALYDTVYNQYGPFLFLLYSFVLDVTGAEATNDFVRIQTVVLWSGCVLLLASVAWRLTGSLSVTVVTILTMFAALTALREEPGHPQALGFFLVCTIPAIGTWITPKRRLLLCSLLGAAVGCLLMVKVNVGLLAAGAVALWIASQVKGRLGNTLFFVCSAGTLFGPVVLMRAHLTLPDITLYAIVASCGAATAVVVHWRARDRRSFGWQEVAVAAAAASGVVAACFVGLASRGTSAWGFLDGVLLQHLQFANAWHVIPQFTSSQAVVAGLGLASCLALAMQRRPIGQGVRFLVAVAQLAFTLGVVWTSVFLLEPYQAAWTLGWLWLVAADEVTGSIQLPSRAPRRLLLAVAAANAMQAYPVAGTHAVLAFALTVPIASVCAFDAIRTLANGAGPTLVAARLVLAAFVAALVGVSTIGVRAFYDDELTFPKLVALDLPGARLLYLRESQVAAFRWISLNLAAHSDTFLSDPGLNSFYVWSGLEPPTSMNAGAWPALFSAERQTKIVTAAEGVARLCAIRSRSISRPWRRVPRADVHPLDTYLAQEFVTRASFAGYEFLVRPGMANVELTYSGEYDDAGRLRLRLPPLGTRAIHRIQVLDYRLNAVFVDSHGSVRFDSIRDAETGEDVTGLLDGRLDVNRPRELVLSFAQVQIDRSRPLLVRLIDDRGEVIAPVPVLY